MAAGSIYDILNVKWVQDNFLVGVDLTDDNGNPFPDTLFDSALRKAVAETAQQLDIVIEPIEVSQERHDLTQRERESYWPYHLFRRPLIAIDGLTCLFGDQEVVEIPPSWVNIHDHLHALVHILPQKEGVTKTMPLLVPSLSVFRWDYVPGWFQFRYRAGFQVCTDTVTFAGPVLGPPAVPADTEKTVTFAAGETYRESRYFTLCELEDPDPADADIVVQVRQKLNGSMVLRLSRAPTKNLIVRWYTTNFPDNLRQLIGIRAAKTPLATAGDLVMGAGIQNYSIGLDGLSQNRTTTKSAAGGAFAGRMAALEREEMQLLDSLKAAYSSFRYMAI